MWKQYRHDPKNTILLGEIRSMTYRKTNFPEIWFFSQNSRWQPRPCWTKPEVVMHVKNVVERCPIFRYRTHGRNYTRDRSHSHFGNFDYKSRDRRPGRITVRSEDIISWATFGLVCGGRWARISTQALQLSVPRPNRSTGDRVSAVKVKGARGLSPTTVFSPHLNV